MADEKIDHTHPLFLHPSDTPSSVMILIELIGSENYGLWSRTIRIALQVKRKLGEIITISQGTNSVDSYFTRLKEMWSEHDALFPTPSCDYAKSKDYIEHLHRQRLLQFLSGLNETYE
ncbi:uncharacterized protein LOC142177337 [Nicotiana tabacum]|uniref:Uncharacterized protein LOC142177337 n=1 Tax=Nicotiana tabacum TaxID=4097 RepID=A0AC58TXF3_TOBAC